MPGLGLRLQTGFPITVSTGTDQSNTGIGTAGSLGELYSGGKAGGRWSGFALFWCNPNTNKPPHVYTATTPEQRRAGVAKIPKSFWAETARAIAAARLSSPDPPKGSTEQETAEGPSVGCGQPFVTGA